jgi:Tfp pilus assembly protein PilV
MTFTASMSRPRSTAGFTLVEILACILLFSLGVTAVIGVIVQGMRIATRAQGDATAWATAMAVLKDPLPLGSDVDPATGLLTSWAWSKSGNTWSATEAASGDTVWSYTTWSTDQPADLLVSDMGNPRANNPAVFPPGSAPSAGCAFGWMNGYYIERREQSRAADRIGQGVRMVEVRVDVYWAGLVGSEAHALASVVDRYIRQEAP